jgi:hypothetical protein
MFFRLAVRDASIIAVVVVLWRLTAHWTLGESIVGDGAGVMLGLLAGLCLYLLHEWGHLTGALLSGSRVAAPTSLKTIFLFSFDSKHNSLRQFLIMSLSGFAASAVVIWSYYAFLPDDLFATRVARGAAVIGVFLTIVLEFPLVAYALLGRGLPPVENSIHQTAQPTNPTPTSA